MPKTTARLEDKAAAIARAGSIWRTHFQAIAAADELLLLRSCLMMAHISQKAELERMWEK